jgi:pimeloyl-ACP methyl ester carboxylesterase
MRLLRMSATGLSMVLGIWLLSADASSARQAEWSSQLVDVGGRRLYLECAGTGTPTIILESGLGESQQAWGLVKPALAASTRVCAYDRANTGLSDPAPKPRTSGQIVDDLNALLNAAGVEPPYLLVGWSFGGANVRLFAKRRPTDVAGIVLVDSVHEDQIRRWLAPLPPFGAMPEVDRQAYVNARTMLGNIEGIDFSASLHELVVNPMPLPDVPLVVLAHGRPIFAPSHLSVVPDAEQQWRDMQYDLAHQITGGTLFVADQSGHAIQRDQPELVIEAVHMVLAATE